MRLAQSLRVKWDLFWMLLWRLSTMNNVQTGCDLKSRTACTQEKASANKDQGSWLCAPWTFVSVSSSDVQAQAIKCVNGKKPRTGWRPRIREQKHRLILLNSKVWFKHTKMKVNMGSIRIPLTILKTNCPGTSLVVQLLRLWAHNSCARFNSGLGY